METIANLKKECAYHHKENANQGDKGTQIKIDILEKIVTEMANKLLYLESKLRDIKKKSLPKENNINQPNPVTGDKNTKETAEIKAQKYIVK